MIYSVHVMAAVQDLVTALLAEVLSTLFFACIVTYYIHSKYLYRGVMHCTDSLATIKSHPTESSVRVE